jgi:hypothetical protein
MAGIPDYQSLMLPLLEIAAKGETSVPLAATEIADRYGLSDRPASLTAKLLSHPPKRLDTNIFSSHPPSTAFLRHGPSGGSP